MTITCSGRRRLFATAALTLTAAVAVAVPGPGSVLAKGGGACDDGGFRAINPTTGAVVNADSRGTTVAAGVFGSSGTIAIRGRYNQFDVRLADFATLDYAFTGVAGPKDITGG